MQTIELSVSHLRFHEADQVEVQLPRFCVFDGSCRIVVEAQSEQDAHYLCSEMGWEFIYSCES
jgi:ferredoxin-like protein FixX